MRDASRAAGRLRIRRLGLAVSEALDRGHAVTAIVRHPERLETRDGLTVKAGDVHDTAALASLIAGHEALISAFNPAGRLAR